MARELPEELAAMLEAEWAVIEAALAVDPERTRAAVAVLIP
jgi:hypothetical protein